MPSGVTGRKGQVVLVYGDEASLPDKCSRSIKNGNTICQSISGRSWLSFDRELYLSQTWTEDRDGTVVGALAPAMLVVAAARSLAPASLAEAAYPMRDLLRRLRGQACGHEVSASRC